MNIFIRLLSVVLIGCLNGCGRQQHNENLEKAVAPKAIQNSTPSIPPANEVSFFNIYMLIGRDFDSKDFAKMLGAPQVLPANESIKRGQTYIYVGRRDSGMHGTSVILQKGKVATIDITIDISASIGKDLRNRLLQGFHKIGNQKASLLDEKLQEKQFNFDEFALDADNIHALQLNNFDRTRVLFFNPAMTAMTDVLPSASRLPKGLLDRARRVIEQERAKQSEAHQ